MFEPIKIKPTKKIKPAKLSKLGNPPLHPDETILPVKYIGNYFKTLAGRMFTNYEVSEKKYCIKCGFKPVKCECEERL
jgi:hypothetical protein